MILWCTRGYDSASKKTSCRGIHDGIYAEAKNAIRDACAFDRLNDSAYIWAKMIKSYKGNVQQQQKL